MLPASCELFLTCHSRPPPPSSSCPPSVPRSARSSQRGPTARLWYSIMTISRYNGSGRCWFRPYLGISQRDPSYGGYMNSQVWARCSQGTCQPGMGQPGMGQARYSKVHEQPGTGQTRSGQVLARSGMARYRPGQVQLRCSQGTRPVRYGQVHKQPGCLYSHEV